MGDLSLRSCPRMGLAVCEYVLGPGVVVRIPIEQSVAACIVNASVWASLNRCVEKAGLRVHRSNGTTNLVTELVCAK